MDPRSAPERIVPAHGANQLANFPGRGRTARLDAANLPGPEQAKALPMPSDDRRGFHDVDPGPPVVPDGTEPRPQQSVRGCELWPFHRALKDTDFGGEAQESPVGARPGSETSPKARR